MVSTACRSAHKNKRPHGMCVGFHARTKTIHYNIKKGRSEQTEREFDERCWSLVEEARWLEWHAWVITKEGSRRHTDAAGADSLSRFVCLVGTHSHIKCIISMLSSCSAGMDPA